MKNTNIFALIIALCVILSGCRADDSESATLDATDSLFSTDMNKTSKPFFGVWKLDKIALTVYDTHEYELLQEVGLYYYGIPVNIEDYLGYEIEFTEEFVRLGDRYLYNPDYYYSANLLSGGSIFSNSENTWLPAYYNSPEELISLFRNKEDTDKIYLSRASIAYPEYPLTYFQGSFLDPEFPEYLFNPLFGSIIMLDENNILVGNTDVVLAERIN